MAYLQSHTPKFIHFLKIEIYVQVYFSQFRKTPFGMLRLDPQDAGPGYRNVIGIPGGVHSPLFKILQVRS